MRSRGALPSAFWLFVLARPALAETQPMHVSYTAPAGCSSRDTFVRELTLRTARVAVVDAAEPAASFVVELVDRGPRVLGQLRLIEPDGSETARAVSGATCEEVVPALALIAAVLVDPESLTRARTPPPAAAPAEAPHPEPSSWRIRPSLGVGAALATAVGPGLSPGVLLELGLESERVGERGPVALIALEHSESPSKSTTAGDAYFTASFGRLTLCPLRWPSRGPLFLSPCAAFEAGALHAEPSKTLGKRPLSVLWLAVDPALGFEYRPLPALSLGLGVLGVFPLRRDRFAFAPSAASQPDILVFSLPTVGAAVQAGVKAVWP